MNEWAAAGLVGEWTSLYYDDSSYQVARGVFQASPRQRTAEGSRVVRGGSWSQSLALARALGDRVRQASKPACETSNEQRRYGMNRSGFNTEEAICTTSDGR